MSYDTTKFELVPKYGCEGCVHLNNDAPESAGDCNSTPCMAVQHEDNQPRVLVAIRAEVAHPALAAPYGAARNTDPDTSHAAAGKDRTPLRERVLTCITYSSGNGRTGHEVCTQLTAQLNSVTPRFAELRKLGKIKDSGERRDGQIVWVLA